MTLAPGDLGIDYSYGRPDLKAAVSAGAKFALRYSAGAASATSHPSHGANAGKLITPAEFKAILAAGLDIIANDEWYETRITEGATAGRQDGAASLALWRSCGLAKGSSIFVSWDSAVVSSKYASVASYLSEFSAALGGYYHVDMYGGTPALREMLRRGIIRYGWRPNAGSWSGDGLPYQPDVSTAARRAALVVEAARATPAHLWQTGNYWFSKTADENMIVRVPVGSHREASAPPPTPAPTPTPVNKKKGNEMLFYQVERASVPAGKPWPGVFIKAPGSKPEHVLDNDSAKGIGQNLGVVYGVNMPAATYAQHELWASGSAALLAPHPAAKIDEMSAALGHTE